MGTITRHSGAPFATGETLDGTDDLEFDINAIVTECNGQLDDSNIASAADIDGSKLLANSIANAKMTTDTLTTAKMNASAVPKANVSTSTSADALTTSATMADITGITDITMTPGSTSDMIFLDLTVDITAASSASTYAFGFSVDGTDTADIGSITPDSDDSGPITTLTITYAEQASGTSAIVLKPRHRRSAGSTAHSFSTNLRSFRAMIIPIK